MKLEYWALLAGVVVLGIMLYANANCATCKSRQVAMSGYEVWPGVGAGVPERGASDAR